MMNNAAMIGGLGMASADDAAAYIAAGAAQGRRGGVLYSDSHLANLAEKIIKECGFKVTGVTLGGNYNSLFGD